MNGYNDSQKLDLILKEQKKLRSLVDKVEISLSDEIVKNRKEIAKNTNSVNDLSKEIKGVRKVFENHQERITSLEDRCPSSVLT